MIKPKRILITKLASMGDLIHLLPALTDARLAYPDIVFDWIVDKNFCEIASWHPFVDKIILTNHRTWRSNLTKTKTWREFFSMIRILREKPYDLVIDAQGNIKSAILSLFAKGPSIGFDGSSIREWGAHLLYKKKFSASKKLHAIDTLRTLLSKALNYPLPKTAPNYQIKKETLVKPSISIPSSYLLFVPIASHTSKLWPEEHWKLLIEKARSLGYPILLPFGNPEEEKRVKRLTISPDVVVLPRLSLSEIGYLTLHAKAVVSLDTGISHIAAALGTPTITLYGPTNPFLTGTIGKDQVWISSFSLHQITPADVLDKLKTLLETKQKINFFPSKSTQKQANH